MFPELHQMVFEMYKIFPKNNAQNISPNTLNFPKKLHKIISETHKIFPKMSNIFSEIHKIFL